MKVNSHEDCFFEASIDFLMKVSKIWVGFDEKIISFFYFQVLTINLQEKFDWILIFGKFLTLYWGQGAKPLSQNLEIWKS
jgi:hypothetical protein